jgi:predicted nucleotide-binding protein (sugar kinase/HSP70/actin superfamily)
MRSKKREFLFSPLGNFKKPKITFANWGNYTLAFKTLFENLGFEVILPEKTNPQTITQGAEISPEMFCFPLKVNLGNYLNAIKKGANTIFMATASTGSCRLRYYGITQEKILKERDYNVNFIIFDQGLRDIYSKIKEVSGASFFKILRAFYYFWRKLRFIEKLERQAQYLRPREIEKGATERVLTESIAKIENMKSEKDFPKLKKEILKSFSKIKIDKKRNLPKVGLIGEIYTVCDPNVNFEIERKLGEAGIEVNRQMNLSYHLKKKIFFKDFFIQKKIKPYLGSTVGGHGRDAIYEMLKYIKEGFDGVIHLLPAMCMPEVTVRPILEKIHQESGIPFLSLSLDEQVAEAGINTRLEAFIDVVKNYHKHNANKCE